MLSTNDVAIVEFDLKLTHQFSQANGTSSISDYL